MELQAKRTNTQLLREIFAKPETELMPFGALAVHAQMAQAAGFKCFHLSGAFTAFWLNGEPDIGLMTRSEVLDNARRVVAACDIPVYCDADTGYGGIHNVRKTVHEFMRAGLAGMHIEDQLDPKKGGTLAGIALVSDAEAIGRLNAACAARDELDPDFVITARTDGYCAAGGGIDEAIRRGKLYREHTDADVIFFEGLRSWEEIERAHSEVQGPVYTIASRHAGHHPSLEELTRIRQAIQIVQFVAPSIGECWKLLLEVRECQSMAPMDAYLDAMFALAGTEAYTGYGDRFVNPSYPDVEAFEARYLPDNMQRDYKSTSYD